MKDNTMIETMPAPTMFKAYQSRVEMNHVLVTSRIREQGGNKVTEGGINA